MIPVVAIVGWSKTGKTTLVEKLIAVFTEKGLKVAAVKHHHKDFSIDIPGKDTYRYKSAGASTTILVTDNKIALVEDVQKRYSLHDIMTRYVRDVDLCIAEGFKREAVPKIEITANGESAEECLYATDSNIIAVIGDDVEVKGLPTFKRDDTNGIVAFIESEVLRKEYHYKE